MKREDLLKEMKDSVGTKDPIEFFAKMVDVLSLLFDRLDTLDQDMARLKMQPALAIQWDPRVASDMISLQVKNFRQDKDKDAYTQEIGALKIAFAEDKVTQSYDVFCKFWRDTLGWHPFLD